MSRTEGCLERPAPTSGGGWPAWDAFQRPAALNVFVPAPIRQPPCAPHGRRDGSRRDGDRKYPTVALFAVAIRDCVLWKIPTIFFYEAVRNVVVPAAGSTAATAVCLFSLGHSADAAVRVQRHCGEHPAELIGTL